MKRLVMICLLLAAAAMPVSIASAQTDWRGPKELADNAALKYWLAFGTLTTLTDADYNLIMNWHGSGPDPAAAHVVELCETSLRMFHEAVKCKWCNWGLVNEGPGTEMPHLAKVRELARRACFRARYRAATGDGNGAVEDILAVFALSRHCNADSSPIAYLVRLAIQRLATNAAADTLERLNPEQLGKLAEGLDSLPQCCSLRDAFLDESENRFGWWADHIKRGGIKAAEEFRRLDSAEDEAQKANSKEPITEEERRALRPRPGGRAALLGARRRHGRHAAGRIHRQEPGARGEDEEGLHDASRALQPPGIGLPQPRGAH